MDLLTLEDAGKVLGIGWNKAEDAFFFNPKHIVKAAEGFSTTITKRQLLKVSSQIFDPFGFLSPFTLKLKLLFQRTWQCELGWDQPVIKDIHAEWFTLMRTLPSVEVLRIPRWARWGPQQELHTFCDASIQAYGAVVYSRRVTEEGDIYIRLIASKTKLAPVKNKLTLPRLELMGAVLGSRLSAYVIAALKPLQWKTYYWVDSQVALGWIRGDPFRWKEFVRNRVDSIRTLTKPEDWGYCPGE